jgi:hypothetical protein
MAERKELQVSEIRCRLKVSRCGCDACVGDGILRESGPDERLPQTYADLLQQEEVAIGQPR